MHFGDRHTNRQTNTHAASQLLVLRCVSLRCISLHTLEDMKEVGAIIRAHHEYYDGTGFPNKLVGQAIPIGARIVAIVEAYEELQAGDYAKEASSAAEAVRTILGSRGTLFCPDMTDIFAKALQS